MQFEHTAQGAVGAQFAAVPAELKQRRQWVVWRGIIQKGADGSPKIAKHPYRADDPSIPADVKYPHTWCSYEEAIACYTKHGSVVSGIGFVLTTDDPYVVFDIDDPKKHPAMHQGYREDFMRRIGFVATFVEKSPSGTGYHVWMRGRMPRDGQVLAVVGAEVYSSRRFMTVTGDVVSDTGVVGEGQGFLDTIGLGAERPQVQVIDDPRLPCIATDEQVLQWAETYSPGFRPQFAGRDLRPYKHSEIEDWSATYLSVLSVLTKITGSIQQIYRLVTSSGLALDCAPHSNGESRLNKSQRLFRDNIARVRGDALHHRYYAEHGAQVWGAILAERERLAAEVARREADRLAAEEAAAAAYRLHYEQLGKSGRVVEGYSSQAEDVLKRFTMFDWEHRKMTLPPGRMGRFVQGVMDSAYISDDRFATPTALAALSGIVARSYATDGGAAPNLNFLMLGKPGTGKSSAMEAWTGLLADTLQSPPAQYAGKRGNIAPPLSDHIIQGKMSSGHGFHMSVQEKPSAVWFLDEAAGQYNEMVDAKDKNGVAILGVFNQLYDKAKHGEVLTPPSSMATRQSGMIAVAKPAVSVLWACPPDSIDITTDALVSGLLSRLIIVNNPSNGQVPRRDVHKRSRCFSEELKCCLMDVLNVAARTNFYYKPNPVTPYGGLVVVDTSRVQDMAADFEAAAMGVVIAGNEKSLPSHYTAFARIASSAMRLAALLAIIEHPYYPSVTGEMYRWAAGYVVQNLALLLSGMDSGETGSKASDEWLAVKRCYSRLIRKAQHGTEGGVSRGMLLDAMKDLKVFYASKIGSAKAASACLDLMVREGVLVEGTSNTGKRGRPGKTLTANRDHDLWDS